MAATPILVARTEELAAVELAAAGEAATVIVSGEAGVGKSRLVDELMRRARADGALESAERVTGESLRADGQPRRAAGLVA